MKSINRILQNSGLEKAEYIRSRSLNYPIKPRLTEEEAKTFRQLTGMANNLNQLAKAANKREILTREILKALEGINLAIQKLVS